MLFRLIAWMLGSLLHKPIDSLLNDWHIGKKAKP